MRLARIVLATAVLSAALVGCGKHSLPNTIFMPDMVYNPSFKAQEHSWVTQAPVKGTVPRGFQGYPAAYARDPELAGRELRNPIHRSASALNRGQAMYNVYCIVCHGPAGDGDGSVVPKYPRPPSLHSDKVVGWADGRIYHVISMGQNLMPSYASQLDPADRWAIIHYIRALQKSKKPTAEDLKAAEQES